VIPHAQEALHLQAMTLQDLSVVGGASLASFLINRAIKSVASL
jgi:hypothetical protein